MKHSCVCRTCGKHFIGGPRAWYCPDCREERKAEASIQAKKRKRSGQVREIGSIDICERCGAEYTVDGSLQRFCPNCQPIYYAEVRRKQCLAYYHKNSNEVNKKRNPKRRKGPKKCVVCGEEFVSPTRKATCSDKCASEHRRRLQRIADAKRSTKNKAKPRI